jgi:intracellular multiplication protein IcmE
VQALVGIMEGQSKDIMAAWNSHPGQTFVQGEWARRQFEEEKKRVVASERAAGGATVLSVKKNALIKAGTVVFAVLDTAVNSDEPGPVLATIVSGELKGAKLLGTMTATTIAGANSPEKVTLQFNLMNMPTAPSSIPIQAVAIDPDTARTALASAVDHHYFLRYAAIFASAFMTGYAQVITSQGTVQTNATNGQSTTTTSPNLSGQKQIYAALGNVGQKWGAAVAPIANRPYTVTVNAGIGLGILFLSDVKGN